MSSARGIRPPTVIVNPRIEKRKGHQTYTEGCLSLPGQLYTVTRPMKVVLQGENVLHRPVQYRLTGWDTRVACHEIDHLDGKLISDVGEPA